MAKLPTLRNSADMTGEERALYLRYLGALTVLADCARLVKGHDRDRIEMALADAALHHPLQVFPTAGGGLAIEPITLAADNGASSPEGAGGPGA